VPLDASHLGLTIALALTPFVIVELGKAALRTKGWAIDPEDPE
jgi:hypothetical protein